MSAGPGDNRTDDPSLFPTELCELGPDSAGLVPGESPAGFPTKWDRGLSGRHCWSLTDIQRAKPQGSSQKVTSAFRTDVLESLKKVRADLDSLLATRQSLLRRLCGRSLKKQTVHSPKSKIGRNNPCPCGSGKKWQKCCGA
jgi:hypothetical protein